VRLLTPAAILTRLGSRLNLLTRGAGANSRQQTLRDTIAWSFGLLSDTEQAAFRRLAVFAGGATVDAGEAVIQAVDQHAAPALDDIAALADHSLLRVEHQTADGAPRVRMLETIREYAAEQLTASGEDERCHLAHARYFLDLAGTMQTEIRTPRPGPALATLHAEDDNLRAALDWLAGHPDPDQPDAELRLAASLMGYWRLIGRYAEAAERLTGALERVDSGSDDARAQAWQGLGFIAARQGALARAASAYEAALDLRRRTGDRAGEADALQFLAELADYRAHLDEAQALREEVLAIHQELGDDHGIAIATHDLGVAALFQGNYDDAIARFNAAIPTFRRAADARNLALALNDLTAAEMLSGQGDAVRHAAEGVAIWQALDDRYAAFQACLTHGRALQLAGDIDAAIPILEAGLADGRENGDTAGISLALYGLGLCWLARGEHDRAFTQLTESLRISHGSGERWHIAERLEALAVVWSARGDAARAARLLGAAAALREAGGFPVPPAERPALDHVTDALVRALGADGLNGEMTTGQAAALDDVVAEAVDGSGG